MKTFSKDDLIRKTWTRHLILMLGILSVVIGSKHIGYYGVNWKGGLVVIFGVLFIYLVYSSMEILLAERRPSRVMRSCSK